MRKELVLIACSCGRLCGSKEEVEKHLGLGHSFKHFALHNFLIDVENGIVPEKMKLPKEKVSFT